jgi:hypothetical protein
MAVSVAREARYKSKLEQDVQKSISEQPEAESAVPGDSDTSIPMPSSSHDPVQLSSYPDSINSQHIDESPSGEEVSPGDLVLHPIGQQPPTLSLQTPLSDPLPPSSSTVPWNNTALSEPSTQPGSPDSSISSVYHLEPWQTTGAYQSVMSALAHALQPSEQCLAAPAPTPSIFPESFVSPIFSDEQQPNTGTSQSEMNTVILSPQCQIYQQYTTPTQPIFPDDTVLQNIPDVSQSVMDALTHTPQFQVDQQCAQSLAASCHPLGYSNYSPNKEATSISFHGSYSVPYRHPQPHSHHQHMNEGLGHTMTLQSDCPQFSVSNFNVSFHHFHYRSLTIPCHHSHIMSFHYTHMMSSHRSRRMSHHCSRRMFHHRSHRLSHHYSCRMSRHCRMFHRRRMSHHRSRKMSHYRSRRMSCHCRMFHHRSRRMSRHRSRKMSHYRSRRMSCHCRMFHHRSHRMFCRCSQGLRILDLFRVSRLSLQ